MDLFAGDVYSTFGAVAQQKPSTADQSLQIVIGWKIGVGSEELDGWVKDGGD